MPLVEMWGRKRSCVRARVVLMVRPRHHCPGGFTARFHTHTHTDTLSLSHTHTRTTGSGGSKGEDNRLTGSWTNREPFQLEAGGCVCARLSNLERS